MRLTGKAKELFTNWLHKYMMMTNGGTQFRFSESFKYLPESMQWGVYQDFADSLGYELYISKESPLEYFWAVCDLIRSFNEGNCKTRQKARNAAIEKLNELINEK